ncbi:hypothetical protein FIBSPDRAFT_886396 [Athelia psychrophila]|uniref:Uncharacterized protein n=1 Tax=Athelia psychrophila TaxID=1759441 RepID=A0A166QSU8_9AGAM|nr:hypothetical protein FIBSPDRAFT_886396 [Fibularhizoctonia sp. CBS 109695]
MLRPLKSCDADPELKSLLTLEDKNRVIDQRIRAATALFAGPMPEAGAEFNDGNEDIMDIGRWYRKYSNQRLKHKGPGSTWTRENISSPLDWEIRFSEPLTTWLMMKGEIRQAQEGITMHARILQSNLQHSCEGSEERDLFEESSSHTIKTPIGPCPDQGQKQYLIDASVAAEPHQIKCIDSTVTVAKISTKRAPRTVTALQRELQAEMELEAEREAERELQEQAERTELDIWFATFARDGVERDGRDWKASSIGNTCSALVSLITAGLSKGVMGLLDSTWG